jgi:murein DD-endopeptidase MepM/ murein hydrolase activator NlpD
LQDWVYPVPNLGDRTPEISDGWGSPRTNPDGSRRSHLGVDLMFARRFRGELADLYPPSTPNGSPRYFMPDGVPALAASAGVVTTSKDAPTGGTVHIRHADGWTTYYTHLASRAVIMGQSVAAGDPVGIIGASPLDRQGLKHLHFELWRDHTRDRAVDPGPYVRTWARITVDDPRFTARAIA